MVRKDTIDIFKKIRKDKDLSSDLLMKEVLKLYSDTNNIDLKIDTTVTS